MNFGNEPKPCRPRQVRSAHAADHTCLGHNTMNKQEVIFTKPALACVRARTILIPQQQFTLTPLRCQEKNLLWDGIFLWTSQFGRYVLYWQGLTVFVEQKASAESLRRCLPHSS